MYVKIAVCCVLLGVGECMTFVVGCCLGCCVMCRLLSVIVYSFLVLDEVRVLLLFVCLGYRWLVQWLLHVVCVFCCVWMCMLG